MNIIHDIRTINALLTEAERQALSLGDSAPGAEHLVLAALMLDEGSARDLLGINDTRFRDALVATHAAALEKVGISVPAEGLSPAPAKPGVYRSEASAQEVFQRAKVLAKQDRGGLKGAHIIRAAAEREHGTVARVLKHLGIDREFLR
ncbi:MAG: Clp protease [Tessaracoccus sp.]|uniref:Clp protease N-terminal domain-containing protein n=1 Tax=Tessaracoccus sp. TaxID=1971211 RepID=UPI001EC51390|nr:Clp protease N-terminal domain-containing protein [Tessaracoccus sp.]MBK7822012.1 Clp protease [Tessaracoccus sp.]